MMYFSLAKEFNWLPDEIDRQEPKKIRGVIHILSAYNNVKNQMAKKPSSSQGTFSKGGKQFVNITDPKVEKSLAEGTYRA